MSAHPLFHPKQYAQVRRALVHQAQQLQATVFLDRDTNVALPRYPPVVLVPAVHHALRTLAYLQTCSFRATPLPSCKLQPGSDGLDQVCFVLTWHLQVQQLRRTLTYRAFFDQHTVALSEHRTAAWYLAHLHDSRQLEVRQYCKLGEPHPDPVLARQLELVDAYLHPYPTTS